MFKKRLVETGITIVLGAIFFGIVWLISWGGSFLPEYIKQAIPVIVMCILALGIFSIILYHVWNFIKWLFVEPYRESKNNK
jgi:hypothetical protein